jgi:hypothetical protein
MFVQLPVIADFEGASVFVDPEEVASFYDYSEAPLTKLFIRNDPHPYHITMRSGDVYDLLTNDGISS